MAKIDVTVTHDVPKEVVRKIANDLINWLDEEVGLDRDISSSQDDFPTLAQRYADSLEVKGHLC